MNKELTLKLVKRFPVIYQDFYSPMSQTCMCWGFDHDDGWFEIIWQLSLAIEEELHYSRAREQWFLFKKNFNRVWNAAIYKISPVRRAEYKCVGSGKKDDPIRQVLVKDAEPTWDEQIIRALFGETGGKLGMKRLGLKRLIYWAHTGFHVDQVKEKFGTLRFYCGGNDQIYKYVRLAENLSGRACEICGKNGKCGQVGGWYTTRCKEHAAAGHSAYVEMANGAMEES